MVTGLFATLSSSAQSSSMGMPCTVLLVTGLASQLGLSPLNLLCAGRCAGLSTLGYWYQQLLGSRFCCSVRQVCTNCFQTQLTPKIQNGEIFESVNRCFDPESVQILGWLQHWLQAWTTRELKAVPAKVWFETSGSTLVFEPINLTNCLVGVLKMTYTTAAKVCIESWQKPWSLLELSPPGIPVQTH